MSQTDRRLSEGLGRIADRMPPAHLDLAEITQTPKRAPSTWRSVAIVVAATVAAIAIPVVSVLLIHHLSSQKPPVTTPTSPTAGATPSSITSAVSPSPGATAVALPTLPLPTRTIAPSPTLRTPAPQSSVTFSLSDLPMGAAPAIPYYSDGKFYPAGGGPGVPITLASPDAVGGFGRYGTGWVAILSTGPSTLETRIYDAQGKQIRAYPYASLGIAHGQDGSTAVSLAQGTLTLVSASGAVLHTWSLTTPLGQVRIVPLTVLPDHSVVFRAEFQLPASAQVTFGAGQEIAQAFTNGTVRALTWGQGFSVNPVNLDATMPTLKCASVFAIHSLSPRWTTCPEQPSGQPGPNERPGPFSPDGKLVAAYVQSASVQAGKQHYQQKGNLEILDAATGAVKVQFNMGNPNQFYIRDVVWEDDTHVLGLFWSNASQTMTPVRFGLNGSVEQPKTVPLVSRTYAGSLFLGESLFELQTPFG